MKNLTLAFFNYGLVLTLVECQKIDSRIYWSLDIMNLWGLVCFTRAYRKGSVLSVHQNAAST